ncbi:nuclear transport factor 2 family protein [Secundilactobacillus collinoides]|uniref:DUF4440 domain-containing protein n=1 Tax=Secundilactobacillus collinoides TaxID=33960 RepID=A0A166GEH6_SECCO|nr:nuclear transport factor 2 family protein [Secundilactobacillus collinoides]KZL38861.1 hypothetical protein TY91_11640 [Secundilactobacillus collinoides]
MTDKEAVLQLYRDHNKYMVAGDVKRLGALLDDDFYLKHMTGMMQDKATWLGEIQSGQMHYFSSDEAHVDISELSDDQAVLVGQSQVDASIHGSRNTWPLELTLHDQKIDGQWRIMYITARMY